jgi:glycosyltransferase involved in cell wall biosynthesis
MSGDDDVVMIAGRDPCHEVSGGHSGYVRSYARAAVMAGFTPHIFCVGRNASTTETTFGVIHRVRSPYRPFRQMLAAAHARPLAAAIVRFAAARTEPVLIHSFGVWGVAGVRAARLLKTKKVNALLLQSSYTTYRDEALSQVRGGGAYSLSRRLRFAALSLWVKAVVETWERRAYLGARLILVNYESVAQLIRKRHGDKARCRLMPYAAESAFFDEPPEPRGSGVPLIAIVSRHEPRKGTDVLLHALAMVKRGGIPFQARHAGGGRLLEDDRALATSLGLDDCVSIVGVVPDVMPLLRAADIFVLASREEQSGSLAILEALQSGDALIATSIDGLLEDLTDGEDSLLVPPNDSGAIAAALVRLLTDEPLRRRLQAGARSTFKRCFSAQPFAATLGATYRELLHAGRNSRFATTSESGPSESRSE